MVGKISGIAWKEAVRELEGKKSCQVTILDKKNCYKHLQRQKNYS